MQGKLVLLEPARWEVRRHNPAKETVVAERVEAPRSAGAKFLVPQAVRQQDLSAPRPKRKMENSVTWSANDEVEDDFVEEDSPFEDETAPVARGYDVGDHYPGSPTAVGMQEYSSIDLQIMKKELEMLKAQRSEKLRRGGKLTFETVPGEEYGGVVRNSDPDRRQRRRLRSQQVQQEASVREQQGRKRYTVQVDMKGNPCGENRHLWLKCLRGHAADLDFSIDNYNDHNPLTLMNIKQRVDNTFEYEGGIGCITDWSFQSILKSQLKMKRYALKKLMVAGREKPKHIRQDHWVNLSALIADEKKVKQAVRLTQNRAQLQRVSHSGRSEGEITANLVSHSPK